MPAPSFVGDTGWVFDNNMEHPPFIELSAPPGAAVGDRILVFCQDRHGRSDPSPVYTVPGFDFVGRGGYTPVPGSSNGTSVYSARMTAGTFPLSIGAVFANGGVWRTRAVAYRPSHTPGDFDSDGEGNTTSNLGITDVNVVGPGTLVAHGTWGSRILETPQTPNGFTEQVTDVGALAVPDPSTFLAMDTHYDPVDPWPLTLTIAAPPSGTQEGDEISVFVDGVWSRASWALTNPPVMQVVGANGTSFGATIAGTPQMNAQSTAQRSMLYYRHLSYTAGLFPLTITVGTLPAHIPGVGAWGVRLLRTSTRKEPNEVASTYGRADTAGDTAAVLPDSVLSPKPYAPARGTCLAVHSLRYSVIGVDGPAMGSILSPNGFTEELVAAPVTGRLGGFAVSTYQNFTTVDTAGLDPPVYTKPAGSLGCMNALVMFAVSTERGGAWALADKEVLAADPSSDGIIWNKSLSSIGWTQLIALDDPDPGLGAPFGIYRDGRRHMS
jgi:hypothetical protein